MMQLQASNLFAQRWFTLKQAWTSEVQHRATVAELLAPPLPDANVSEYH
jgi:hypothetical protein